MHRDLLDALSTGWVEKALGVSRATVANWRQGEFPEVRQVQLTEAVRRLLPNGKEAVPSDVTERLERVERLLDQLVAGNSGKDRTEADSG